jgi:drug/metabolite transporter (DMT)-like permease
MVLATGVLSVWAPALGQHLPPWRDETSRLSAHWRFFAVLGLVGHVLPFTLITWGQQEVAAGLSAILVGLMPLMTLALAVLFVPSERLDRSHLAGFGLGFLGIVVFTGPEALGLAVHQCLIHEVAILGGACCFAVNAVLIKRMPPIHPLTASVGIFLCAAVIAVPVALLCDAPWALAPSALSLIGLVLLGLLPSALATITSVRLVRAAGPTFAALTGDLVPPVAVFLSGVLLGQRLDWNAYLALICILAGIAASQGRWQARPSPSDVAPEVTART